MHSIGTYKVSLTIQVVRISMYSVKELEFKLHGHSLSVVRASSIQYKAISLMNTIQLFCNIT